MRAATFYVLVRRLEGEAVTEFVIAENTGFGAAPKCKECGLFVGNRAWLPPYQVEIETRGSTFGDIAFGGPGVFLISSRFKTVFVEAGLQGLSGLAPVQILSFHNHKKLTGEIPTYLKADLFRGDIAIDLVASEVEWEGGVSCRFCLLGNKLKRRRRIVIDEETWTGEDIFFARGLPGEFIVSSRFKEVCEVHGVTNAVMIPSIHRR